MIRRLLENSRYIIIIAVIAMLIASLAALILGGVELVDSLLHALGGGQPISKISKDLIVSLIQTADILLLGTVFYIIAMGFYELFIDDSLNLPAWLVIHNLDDLKAKLIGVVIVVLGVAFLAEVISWKGDVSLLVLGAAVAAVILALTLFVNMNRH
jgi:uncharacterized membrane protein YqhA